MKKTYFLPIISYDMGEVEYMFVYDGKGKVLFYDKVYDCDGYEHVQELIKKLEKVFYKDNFQLCTTYTQWSKLNYELLKKAPQQGEELVKRGYLENGYNIIGNYLQIHLEDEIK